MVRFGITFDQIGDFAATNEAERLLKAHGFAIGPSQRGAPRAVMFGNYIVSKWKNLNRVEREFTHATLTGDGRNGPLTLRLLPAAPDAAVEALAQLAATLAKPRSEKA